MKTTKLSTANHPTINLLGLCLQYLLLKNKKTQTNQPRKTPTDWFYQTWLQK